MTADPRGEESRGDISSVVRLDIPHYEASRERTAASALEADDCFAFLEVLGPALPQHCAVNPANQENVSEEFLVAAVVASVRTWNKAIKKKAFNHVLIARTAQAPQVDGTNTILFSDDFLDTSLVASTSLYIDTATKPSVIIEFDILLNAKTVWGDARRNPSVIDVQSVITHELGHALGLADVWSQLCPHVTMYGFITFGETHYRTLSKPDKTALRLLYQRNSPSPPWLPGQPPPRSP